MTDIRAGVVGVGHLGSVHARLYEELPGSTLAAVCDPDEDRAREIAERHGAEVVSLEDMADAVDCASIVTPTLAHHETAAVLLDGGVDVLVEKPMTHTLEEADDLIARAAAGDRVLQVGHVERFNRALMAGAGKVGRVRFVEAHRISPFRFRSADVGVVLDMMIHDIDIVLHLVDSPIRDLRATGVALLSPGSEDIANARLEFDGGCTANVTASRLAGKSLRQIRVFGERGYLLLDLGDPPRAVLTLPSPELMRRLPAITSMDAVDLEGLKGELDGRLLSTTELPLEKTVPGSDTLWHDEPLGRELLHFLDCVKSRRTPLVPGEHGRRALAAALRIVEQVRADDHQPDLEGLGSPHAAS